MAINTALLIAAPMLQDYFVDNVTAQAMSAGVITCYEDNSRTTLKNWYYQTGVPGNYTYVTLPNPLTLSAVGTITDANGNDTIPFFYPVSETDNVTPQKYYITVVDSNGQAQFTRQNFPFNTQNATPVTGGANLNNIVVNEVFWRNVGALDVSSSTNVVLAPGAHDGFTNPDIRFLKNTTGATDNITFEKFTLGDDEFSPQQTPEFYLNMNCSASEDGETLKCIQFPLSLHVQTLDALNATVTLWAQNSSGNANNFLDVSIYQFLGTGASSQPAPIVLQTITLTSAWQQFTINFNFPTSAGATLGAGGDDAYYLQIGFPLALTCNINFALPRLYLGNEVPSNPFTDYDQVNSLISCPRTGDVRSSVNSFSPFGWVPMNNGTIGNTSSNATSRANVDTFQLFSLLWSVAKAYDSGSDSNPICLMTTSAGSATNYGMTAIADWNANKAITLSQMFGNVVMGTVPISSLLSTYSQSITASNSGGNLLITVSSGAAFYNGAPIAFTTTGSLPGNIVANAIYYVSNISGNTFNVCSTYANAVAGSSLIAYSSAGSNSNVTGYITGSPLGNTSQAISQANLPATLNNFFLGGVGFTSGSNSGSGGAFGGLGPPTTSGGSNVTTNSTLFGGGIPFNVIQPSTLYNIFMKL